MEGSRLTTTKKFDVTCASCGTLRRVKEIKLADVEGELKCPTCYTPATYTIEEVD